MTNFEDSLSLRISEDLILEYLATLYAYVQSDQAVKSKLKYTYPFNESFTAKEQVWHTISSLLSDKIHHNFLLLATSIRFIDDQRKRLKYKGKQLTLTETVKVQHSFKRKITGPENEEREGALSLRCILNKIIHCQEFVPDYGTIDAEDGQKFYLNGTFSLRGDRDDELSDIEFHIEHFTEAVFEWYLGH